MIIINHPEACTGCLICELACSFHHTSAFSRSHSSIQISKSIFDPKQGTSITIYETEQGTHPPCDFCEDEVPPLCVRLCPEEVFSLEGGK